MISIITPYYNSGATILETAESLFKQTLAFSEWIIVDDGSCDVLSVNNLNDLASRDQRIKVVRHGKNEGLPTARNTGISNCHGEFLFFIDADDLIDSNYLEKAYLVFCQNEELAFVNSYVIGFEAQTYHWSGGFYEGELFLKENRNTSCFMAKRQVFDHVLFNPEMTEGCEDWEFWLNAASKGLKGYTIPEFLFYYRRSDNSKWKSLVDDKSFSTIRKELSDKYYPLLRGSYPVFTKPKHSFGYVAPEIEKTTTISFGGDKHLICLFPWLEVGGADQFNINFLKGLKAKGWTFTIVTTEESTHPWESKFKELTADIFHLSNYSAEEGFSALLSYLISSRNPDILFISHSKYAYYVLPYLKKRFSNLPIADYTHCVEDGWFNGGYPYFSAKYSAYMDTSFVTSEDLKKWSVAHGANADKVEVCYIGVDSIKVKRDDHVRLQLRQDLSLPNEVPVIMYVARLTEQKQPRLLINVLHALKRKGFQFKCIIIGDGPEKAKLLKLIERLDLKSNIIYLGSQANEAVLYYMNVADIFFLPSKYEGIALSIYEAMAKKLAVVAADVGGQTELVTNECGFLATNNKDSLNVYVNVLSELLSQPEKIAEFGVNARKRIEGKFDLTFVIEMLNDRLLNLVSASPNTQHSLSENEYLLLLNRVVSLERECVENRTFVNSRLVKIISKHSQQISRFKKFYWKLKGVGQR